MPAFVVASRTAGQKLWRAEFAAARPMPSRNRPSRCTELDVVERSVLPDLIARQRDGDLRRQPRRHAEKPFGRDTDDREDCPGRSGSCGR